MPEKKTTILTADDDRQLLQVITLNLQLEGYEVLLARDGKQAIEQIETHAPDLVLLDVMLPKMDGFTVCQHVRTFSTVPIIMITARGRNQDKVRGLDLGADDYLTKPFSMEELLARVRAALRRAQFTTGEHAQDMQTSMTIGDLTIDFAQHLVLMDSQKVVLTPTEYRILACLAQNVGRVVPQDLLLQHVWGVEYVSENHLLQVNINRLRRKLEPDPAHPRYILTETGIGYLLATQPEVQAAP
jgi:DNA-binding response OmpR family regulator